MDPCSSTRFHANVGSILLLTYFMISLPLLRRTLKTITTGNHFKKGMFSVQVHPRFVGIALTNGTICRKIQKKFLINKLVLFFGGSAMNHLISGHWPCNFQWTCLNFLWVFWIKIRPISHEPPVKFLRSIYFRSWRSTLNIFLKLNIELKRTAAHPRHYSLPRLHNENCSLKLITWTELDKLTPVTTH